MGVKDDLVRKIVIQIGTGEFGDVVEVGQDGEVQPFGVPIMKVEKDSRPQPTIVKADCTYQTDAVPMNPVENQTWWRQALGKALRYNGVEWVEFEQYKRPPEGPTPVEPIDRPY
jgi:hypothetical protein